MDSESQQVRLHHWGEHFPPDPLPAAAALPVPLPEGLPAAPPVQQQPIPGEPRGHVRLAVMDGKTITHRVSILEQ